MKGSDLLHGHDGSLSSAFQCCACHGYFCSRCEEPIAEHEWLAVKSVGWWCGVAEPCLIAEAAANGLSVERMRAIREVRRETRAKHTERP